MGGRLPEFTWDLSVSFFVSAFMSSSRLLSTKIQGLSKVRETEAWLQMCVHVPLHSGVPCEVQMWANVSLMNQELLWPYLFLPESSCTSSVSILETGLGWS